MDDNIKIAIIQTLCLDDNADIIAKVNAVEYQKYHEKIDEGDEFSPKSLNGLELLTNCETITFMRFDQITDFSLLFAMPALKELSECDYPEQIKQTLRDKGVELDEWA